MNRAAVLRPSVSVVQVARVARRLGRRSALIEAAELDDHLWEA